MTICLEVLTSLLSWGGMLQWIEWEMHESLLGSCNRQLITKEGIASLLTSRELPTLGPPFEASSGIYAFMYEIDVASGTKRSTVPAEKVLSSDAKPCRLKCQQK